MPADVASMMERGTSLIRRMRRPVTARMMKMIPSACRATESSSGSLQSRLHFGRRLAALA